MASSPAAAATAAVVGAIPTTTVAGGGGGGVFCFQRDSVWVVGSLFWLTMLLHGLCQEYVVLAVRAEGLDLGFFLPFLTSLGQLTTAVAFLFSKAFFRRQRRLRQQQQLQNNKTVAGSNLVTAAVNPIGTLWEFNLFFQYPKLEHFISGIAVALSHGAAGKASMKMPFSTHNLFKAGKVLFVMIAEKLLLKTAMPPKLYIYAVVIGTGLAVLSISDTSFFDFAFSNIVNPSQLSVSYYEDNNSIVYGTIILAVSTLIGAVANVAQQAALQSRSLINESFAPRGSAESVVSSSLIPSKDTPQGDTDEWEEDSDEAKKKNVASRDKESLIVYSSLIINVALGSMCIMNGEMISGFQLFFFSENSPFLGELASAILAIIGQRLILTLSQRWGATSATLFVTLRRISTFFFSIFYFPKKVSGLHIIGLVVVLGSSMSLQNELDKLERGRQKASSNHVVSSGSPSIG